MRNAHTIHRTMPRLMMAAALLIASVRVFSQGSYPMTVTTTAPMPPPVTWAELQDQAAQAMVTVNSTLPGTTSVTARVVIRCQERGIDIRTNSGSLGNCTDVDPGVTTFDVEELASGFSGGFSQSDFTFTGVTYAEVRDQQMLPAGLWELCVQILACGTGEELSGPIPAGCASWFVAESTPPMFTNICNTTMTMPDGLLNIAWVYIPPPGLTTPVVYRLEIVRIDPEDGRDGDANDAMLSATEPELFLQRYDASPAMIEIPDELMLDPGFRYAVRVTVELEGGSPFNPSVVAQSEVCSFLYAPDGPGGNGTLRAVWPTDDDWIPFGFFPIITQFQPYEDYTQFSFHTTLAGNASTWPDRNDVNTWPHGPLRAQRSLIGPHITQEQSTYLPIYHNTATDLGSGRDRFVRGEHYRWRCTGDLTLGGTTHGDSGTETFHVGMGPSSRIAPADDAVLPQGPVTLRWHTADEPSQLIPPHEVMQARRGSWTILNGWVDERWMLEIARDNAFTNVVHTANGTIGGAAASFMNAFTDPAGFRALVYKDLDLNWDASSAAEGTYYWRLHWKTDHTNVSSANYNTSEVFRFCVGRCDETTSTTPPAGEEEEGGGPCVSTCLEPAPTNLTPVGGLDVGDVVRVGKFSMTVQEVSGSGTIFNGRGKIEVDFLNHAHILVEFANLKWNSDGRMVSGDVVARKDWEPPGLSYVTDNARRIPSMSEDAVNMMEGMIVDNARLVTFLMGGEEVGLPIGIDREVGGRQIILGIINMKFDVERAYLDIAAGIEVPEINTKLVFGLGDMCMTPSGLGDEGRAYLPYDITVTGDLSTSYRFRGGASTDVSNITYVDWDCDGFKCMQVAGAVEFDRGTLLPAGDHDPAGTDRVEARFKFSVCRTGAAVRTDQHSDWNVMAAFTMDPFEVPGAPDWVFTVEEAWLDWSTIANPDGIVFPQGYTHPAIIGGTTRDLWKGFYLKRLAMRTPEVIGDGTGNPLTASLNNFMVDDQAELSFNFAITNLLAVNQGLIDSWAFSVDSVYMDMLQNNFQRAGLKGKIGLPINGEHDFIKYGAILGYNSESDEFAFTLEAVLDDTLTAPLWIAEMEIEPNSYVRATLSNNSRVQAELNGRIGISTSFASEMGLGEETGGLPSIRMPGMRFEQLRLDTDRDNPISCGNCAFAYASPQKEVGGFPLSIRNLALEFDDPTHPALVVEPMVSLSGGEGESSFAASVALKFVTELTFSDRGVSRFDFRDVQFTGMHLDVDVSSMRLVGDLRITKTATKEEVKGALSVGFPMGIRGDLQACFGTIKLNTAVPINTSAQHYSYWMVDGMLYFNPGLMIMTGVGIYGFGGGAYHHMRFVDGTLPTNERLRSMAPTTPLDSIPPADANAGTDPPDNFTSGLTADASTVGSSTAPSGGRYEEDFSKFLGIRLGLVFGTYPKPDGCNMDLTLRAEFNRTGGLDLLTVQGDIYGLVDIPERANARITGQIGFTYANREGNEVIHANLSVMLDFGVARGAGTGNKMVDANFHTESATGKWYFIMGTPGNPGGVVLGPPGGDPLISFKNYLMVGNEGIPAQLPDPPELIMEILGLNDPSRGLGTEAETRAAIGGARDMGPLVTGAGFAVGATFEMKAIELDLLILYAKFEMAIGFDVLLTEVPESIVCVETGARPGDNGWYAQGQFYAGLKGELGVQLNLIFHKFQAPILNMSAAMLLQANFPNPSGFRGHAAVHYSVLNGAITGSAKFTVEDGQQCTMMLAGDPLAAFNLIKDLGPKGNDVSVFDMPTASYNLPMHEVLEIPKVIRPDGSVELYRFKPHVYGFTLHEVSGNVNVPGSNTFLDDRGTSSYLSRTEALKEHTNYRTRVEVRVREEYAPFLYREFVAPGSSSAWREERVQNFRTGTAPDHIPENQVEYTYPVNRQRYFLQQESNNKGRVALTTGVSYLFPVSDLNGSYTYVAKFTPLGGGTAQETPILYSGGQFIPLTVPTLEPERIHIVQLVRRKTATSDGLPMINGGMAGAAGVGSVGLPGSVYAAQISAPLTQTFIAANGDVTKLNLTGGNVTRATSLARNEHLLYTFRFRSSKYNTLVEKFAALDLNGRTPARYADWKDADVRGPADEYFDEADIHGVWKNGVQKLQPLVRFAPDYTDNYYSYLDDVMYDRFLQYRSKRTYSFPGNSVSLPAFPMAHWLMWYSKPEPVVSYNGVINGPISNAESETAAAPPSSVPVLNLPGGMGAGAITGPLVNLPGGGILGGMFGGGIITTGPTVSPWHSFGFLYRAGRYAYEDQAVIRMAAFNALNTPGSNGSNLSMLLLANGPALNRMNLLSGVNQHYTAAMLRHTGNLPTPTQEFPIYYNANYRIKMHFRSPITGSRNTTSVKPFTLRYEEPPVYNDGTVLY